MTFLSSEKLGSTSIKAITLTTAFSVLFISALFLSSNALANTCSKSDVDYYLQRGFTNDQVVQLCAGAVNNQNNSQRALISQTPTPVQQQQTQQNNQLREDQSYLSAALDAEDVTMTSQNLTLLPRECIEYGPPNNIDLMETICVNTKLSIDFAGMKIGKASKGLFLVRDASLNVKGNIKRELVGINELRRQDREAILEVLTTNHAEVFLKIRRGISPSTVGDRLKKYIK